MDRSKALWIVPSAAIAAICLLASFSGRSTEAAVPGQDDPSARAALEDVLGASGFSMDWDRGVLGFPVEVLVRDELLEYVLVSENGQVHESLLVSDVPASLVNAGILALGVERGQNARLLETTDGYDVVPPSGDGCYFYVAWQEGDEAFLYRLEDLIANLETGRAMQRHRWVFLGSRFVEDKGEEVFAADFTGNLMSLSYFYEGDTLFTGALEACESQTAWLANSWLLPPSRERVLFLCSKEKLSGLPERFLGELPLVTRRESQRR